MSSSFPHILSSSQTKKALALHIQNAWKSTIKDARLQLSSCNISFQNFIVSSSFAHTPSSSQSKRTHALRIQNTWKHIITVATLLLPSCNISFQNSSNPPRGTHPQLILDQKPHALDIQTHGNYGYHITTPVVERFISELHCVLFICTYPQLISNLKPDALHIQNAWQPTITVATLILPLCNISFQNFIYPSSFTHSPSSSWTKTTHALRIQNTWKHTITVATLLLLLPAAALALIALFASILPPNAFREAAKL